MKESTLWKVDAAAGNVNTTLSVDSYAKLLAHVQVTLVTSATVATRTLQLTVLDEAAATVWSFNSAVTQAASLTYTYTFMPGVPRDASVVSLMVNTPIPDQAIIMPGWSVRVSVTNGVAGDSVTVRGLLVGV